MTSLTLQTTASSPPSHFQGANLPFKTPRANAAHIFRELVGGYCITHPHLDHISGLVINTAGINPGNRKKVIAGLTPTIDALKKYIFNDIIWPNLSDENEGVGFLTYKRLVDASRVDGKIEYRSIVDGLSVQAWPVSHGHCMHQHKHRGSDAAIVMDGGPREKSHPLRTATGLGIRDRPKYERKCVYDSSCFFIRDDFTEKEILIFGDVEPDSVSISEPRRNVYIWNYAAEKMHRGVLSAIFIESSYDITQKDEHLYGHLTPKHVIEELKVLASKVLLHREREAQRFSMPKRRRTADNDDSILEVDPFGAADTQGTLDPIDSQSDDSDVPRSPTDLQGLPPRQLRSQTGKRRRTDGESSSPRKHSDTPAPAAGANPEDTTLPLQGLKVVIIHVKDDFDDAVDVRQSIYNNLIKLEAQAKLGCTFEMAQNGGSMFF
ncbi:3',5'-cyclic-nucleotide phosphodiesterase pde1 [Orbilia brochopaga]|uniref:3',5'-cyclic-nucleotide phosphodiesterase pde1 n=1 Tax=Orbilia brochopaga TaxID=3140254 RepID=A0AAV9UZI6_9PEZI